jgi:PAS domain S-box-containing protein
MANESPGRNWEATMEQRLAESVARSGDLFRSRGSRAVAAGGPSGEIPWRCGLVAAADGVLAVMSDGRITLWNPAAERIMGYTAAEVLGRRCCEVLVARASAGEPLCSSNGRCLTLLKSGKPVETFDLQTYSKGGRPIWLNISTVVLPDGDPKGWRGIRMFRDVTAVKDLLALIRNRLVGIPNERDRIGQLTRRETEVLWLIASGATNRTLAERLHLSPATVRNHAHNIFEKLGVPNRVAAVTLALSQFRI